jgi:1-pyrroline-5-carboxylate dehydrogenase
MELHFTGSTFHLKISGQNWNKHSPLQNIPKIVGKLEENFIIAHSSANPKQVATGIVRGAFEFQGQKITAASNLVTKSLWPAKEQITDVKSLWVLLKIFKLRR